MTSAARGQDPAPLIAGCLLFALVLFLPALLNDGDTLWQISTGAWILDHHAIPATDPFSFTAGGRRWFAHEWLAETVMALAYRAAGMAGIMALAAAATGLTATILMRHLRRYLPGIYALLFLVVALANAAPSMLARPHLLAWPCLILWCTGLLKARANRAAPSFWLLPVMLVWVNLHGSFMFGLLLPFAFLAEAAMESDLDRRRVIVAWSVFIAAAGAVALLNPEGVSGVLFPVTMLRMQSLALIGEWQPASFGSPHPLEFIILGGLAMGLSGAVKVPPMRLLVLLALVHGALAHARNGPLLGLVGALILAEPVGRSLSQAPTGMARQGRFLALAGVAIALAALVGRMLVPLDRDHSGAAFSGLMDRIPSELRSRPVLNEYSLGGHLIFTGVRPFIDSRADLYGDAFLDNYRKIAAPEPHTLDRALTDYAIAWTIFHADHPVVAALDRREGWRRLIAADGIVIHVHNDAPSPGSKTPRTVTILNSI